MQISKSHLLDRKNMFARFFLFFSILTAFLICFPQKYIPWSLFLWNVSAIALLIIHFKGIRYIPKRTIISIIVILFFFIWQVVSILYSENIMNAFDLLTRRLSIFLLPVIIYAGYVVNPDKTKLLWIFILGNLTIIIWCLIQFIIYIFFDKMLGIQKPELTTFSVIINNTTHYSYLGMNIVLAIVSLAHVTFEKKEYTYNFMLIMVIIISFLFIYVSQARMALITLSCVMLVLALTKYYFTHDFIVSGLLLIILSIGFYYTITYNKRLVHLEEVNYRKANEVLLKIDNNRHILWNEAVTLIKARPWIGYGVGDASKMMIIDSQSGYYNAHNQYLEFILEGGVISLFLFFLLLIIVFFKNVQKQERVFAFSIFLVFIISMLTESVLNRISGIAPLVFFIWYFSIPGNLPKNRRGIFPKITFIVVIVTFLLLMFSFFLLIKTNKFNPKNPETYANRVFKKVSYDNLPGILPEDFPKDTKGYLQDSTCNASTWDGNAYTYTLIGDLVLTNNDSLIASVYCYVSKDFNGDWVRISSEGTSIANQICQYNLLEKGTWQYLKITPDYAAGKVPVYLYFCKYNDSTFHTLNGYVIFAYPQYICLKKRHF